MKEFDPLTMVVAETGKKYFFSYHSNNCYEGKFFMKGMKLISMYYH